MRLNLSLNNILCADGVRAILFDLDGTLRYNHPTFAEAFYDIAARLGAPVTDESRRRASRWLHYYWAKSDEFVADRNAFGDQSEAFWIHHDLLFLGALGCPPGQASDLALQAYQHMIDEFKPQDCVFPDVTPTLQVLKEAGYSLAVLSNRSRPYQEQLEKLGLAGYFEFAMHAGEVGAWKPGPRIFQQGVERLSVRPEQALYVGDNYYADVVGAQRAGLNPILLDPDGLFPEAECPVIRRLSDLPGLMIEWPTALKQLSPPQASKRN